jgi:hypothetical protein
MLCVIRAVVMYFALNHGSKRSYSVTYWSLAVIDTVLELGIVYEIASRVFRPVGVWAQDVRGSFLWMVRPERNRSFGTELAGKPAGAQLGAIVCDQRHAVCRGVDK